MVLSFEQQPHISQSLDKNTGLGGGGGGGGVGVGSGVGVGVVGIQQLQSVSKWASK